MDYSAQNCYDRHCDASCLVCNSCTRKSESYILVICPELTGFDVRNVYSHSITLDLQPSNMLLGVHDNSVLAKFEQYETENPCPRRELDDHTIYLSRPML